MFESLKDWVQAAITDSFTLADGGFPDGPAFAPKHMCVIRGSGGPAPDVEDRRPRYKLFILGPQKDRAAVSRVREAAEALMQACQGDTAPCGAASVKALGEPIGPSYTAEDRAWVSIELQLTY